MNTHAHSVIDILHLRIRLEQSSLRPKHILIIPYSWARLCIFRIQFVHLRSRLVYQRKHYIERYSVLLQNFLAQGIAMIHEIAGKDGREMQVLAVFTRQMIHPTAHLMRHITDLLQGMLIIRLDKTRYLREIHLTLLGESLHRIKHTIM